MASLRVGLIGVNSSHASAFASLLARGAIPDAHLAWVWGGELRADQPDAPTLANRYSIPSVAESPTSHLACTDLVLVVDDTGGGGLHIQLATPFVAAGIATFVNKPMSLDVSSARELFALASTTSAPVMSCSALRYASEIASSRDSMAALGTLSSLVSVGPGEWYYYGIHAVEQLYAVVGPGVEWVQRTVLPARDVAVLSYADGPVAVVETLRDASYAFHLTAHGESGVHTVSVADFDAFHRGQLAAACEMARTGTPPIAPSETLEILGVLRAGVLSGERGGARVMVTEALSTDGM